MADAIQSCPRRHWLLYALQTCVGASVAVLLYPVAKFLRPREATSSGSMQMVAPYRVNQLKPDAEGNWPSPFEFNGKPCLLVCTPEGIKEIKPGVRTDPAKKYVRAFNAVCTHVACTVQYRSDKGDIFCNCHNGLYDLNGHNVSGPPPRPLDEYQVDFRGEPGQEEIIVSRST